MKTFLIISGLYLVFIIIKELFIDPIIDRRYFISGEIEAARRQHEKDVIYS
jgi:hypothetical protein